MAPRTGGGGDPSIFLSGTMIAEATSAEVRSLRVVNRGGEGPWAVAINAQPGVLLRYVTAGASGSEHNIAVAFPNGGSGSMTDVFAGAYGGGEAIGVFHDYEGGSLELKDVTAIAEGATENFGLKFVYKDSAHHVWLTLLGVTAVGRGGTSNTGAELDNARTTIKDSHFQGDPGQALVKGNDRVLVAYSQFVGGVGGSPGLECIGAYDEDFHALDHQCQPLSP